MYRRTQVKTRKPHHCFGCQFVFPEGVILFDCCGVWEGDFWFGYVCPLCDAFLNSPQGRHYSDDGYTEGELYHDGWKNEEEFLKNWLKENKPLSVLYKNQWRKTKKEGYIPRLKEAV